MTLQPKDLASCYTITEIETEITAIKSAITIARQSMRDKFGDSQASQETERQRLKDLLEELAIYVKAKNILNGEDSSVAGLNSINYNPSVPKI